MHLFQFLFYGQDNLFCNDGVFNTQLHTCSRINHIYIIAQKIHVLVEGQTRNGLRTTQTKLAIHYTWHKSWVLLPRKQKRKNEISEAIKTDQYSTLSPSKIHNQHHRSQTEIHYVLETNEQAACPESLFQFLPTANNAKKLPALQASTWFTIQSNI